jgi:hypothetical protein
MIATAISREKSRKRRMKDKAPQGLSVILSQTTQEQSRIKRCPASRFAASRNPQVKGCIRRLTVSIIIIRGIR